jgi:hypothetical protein
MKAYFSGSLVFLVLLVHFGGTAANADTSIPDKPLRLILVVDRSSSMRPSMPYLRTAAIDFVNAFDESRDRLGLVVFGASAIIAYPPRDPTHPDVAPAPDGRFKTSKSGVAALIGSIQPGSNTGTAEALWLAYRQLTSNPVPNALNAIVLFTDGLPNGIAAEFNSQDLGRNLLRRESTCTHKLEPNAYMRGVIAQQCAFRLVCSSPAGVTGIRQQMSSSGDPQNRSIAAWLGYGSLEPLLNTRATAGCAFLSGGQISADVREIPPVDLYGNQTTGDGYRDSLLYNKEHVELDRSAVDSPYQIGLASWNATDSAARRIRLDASLNVVIYVVGLGGGAEPPDDILLQRIANVRTRENSAYAPDRPSGLCTIIDSPQRLEAAFQGIAADIQRARNQR